MVLTLATIACGTRRPPLERAYRSPQDLARAVLGGVEGRDATALRGLALSEMEFRAEVWPELPAARRGRNLPFSFVWGDLRQKSESALGQTLTAHGGESYDLVGVKFLGGTTQYDSYLVHRDTALMVRDATGTQRQLRLFGSMIEKDGHFKVFSYVVD